MSMRSGYDAPLPLQSTPCVGLTWEMISLYGIRGWLKIADTSLFDGISRKRELGVDG